MICLLFNFEDFFSPLKNEKVWKLYVESKPCSQGLRKVWKSRGEKRSKAFWSFDYIPAKIWRGGRSPLLPLSSDGPENKGCDIVIFIGVQHDIKIIYSWKYLQRFETLYEVPKILTYYYSAKMFKSVFCTTSVLEKCLQQNSCWSMNSRHFFQHQSLAKHWFKNLNILLKVLE
jgi:hypothetical protein